MSTHIRVSGLSFFCTDEELRQAFIPFGTVVLEQVLRDESGHSLGLVHMARSEDVERVFNAHQCFKLSDSRVDLWDPPTDPEDYQGERIMALTPRDPPASSSDGARPRAPEGREGAQTIDGAQTWSHPESAPPLPRLSNTNVLTAVARYAGEDAVAWEEGCPMPSNRRW